MAFAEILAAAQTKHLPISSGLCGSASKMKICAAYLDSLQALLDPIPRWSLGIHCIGAHSLVFAQKLGTSALIFGQLTLPLCCSSQLGRPSPTLVPAFICHSAFGQGQKERPCAAQTPVARAERATNRDQMMESWICSTWWRMMEKRTRRGCSG